jgi:hypothetical protein
MRTATLGAAVVAFALFRLGVTASGSNVAADLLRNVGFNASEISAVQRGEPVARVLDTGRREIAVIGAVRIKAAEKDLAERFRTIEYLKSSRMVLGAGAFSTPPSADDLRSVPFEAYDLDVRECRPGDCRVRLSAEDIGRFQREVDWNAPGWQSQSAGVWRQILGGYAAGYFRLGSAALPVFANKQESLSVADETAILLRQFSFVASVAPDVLGRAQMPTASGWNAPEQMIYWSKEDFGVRPVMRVQHQSIHWHPSQPGQPAPPLVISTTQLYAAHYLDAAVGFVVAIEDSSADQSAFHMIMVNRARTRSLTGIFRTMVRSTVQGRCRDAMESALRATKVSLENR